MGINKKKISGDEFAKTLYRWLLLRLTKRKIKKFAKEIHFKIENNSDFDKLYNELLIFNTSLIFLDVITDSLLNIDEVHEILIKLINLILQKYPHYKQRWIKNFNINFYKYYKCTTQEDKMDILISLWEVFSQNLFGQVISNVKISQSFFIYTSSFLQNFREMAKIAYKTEKLMFRFNI